MKKNNRIWFICLALALFLSGCAGKDNAQQTFAEQDGMVKLYYQDNLKIRCDKEQYQLKQPDSVSASVEEIMAALMTEYEGRITFNTYMLDVDNNISLSFTETDEPTKEAVLFFAAAVTKTLFQVEMLGNINIKIINDTEQVILEETYNRNSFAFYSYDSDYNMTKTKIYHADDAKLGLTYTYYNLSYSPDVSLCEKVLEILIQNGYIPKKTRVLSVGIMDGICYLNLSKEFENSSVYLNGELILYALVDSITSLDGIRRVQILVEGAPIENYRGISDLPNLLEYNAQIVSK